MRGTLTAKIKDAIFSVFSENQLPPINANIKDFEIKRWKKTTSVKKCYDKLFKKINSSKSVIYLLKIISW